MLKKVKNWLGIEGVKVKLDLPDTFSVKSKKIQGSFVISSLSEQHVQNVNIVLKEKYTRGRRKSKLIDEYVLGEQRLVIDKTIDESSTYQQDFELSFQPEKSPIDKFGDKNPLYKGISSLAKLIKNAKSKYYLVIEAEVKGNKLKPYDKVEVVAA